MGSRKLTIKICPKCQKQYEVYDAPSSMMYVAKCDCGYDEELVYIDISDHLFLIPLMVKEYIDEITKDDSEEFFSDERENIRVVDGDIQIRGV